MHRNTTHSLTQGRTRAAAAVVVGVVALGTAACGGSDSASGDSSVTVTYQQFGDSEVQKNFLEGVKAQFEEAHPDVTVDLQPIVASEDDYYTKLQLQMRSPRTSPDVVYEDTFLINSDIEAGYLQPLDEHLDEWEDWDQFADTAKGAAKALDGKTYGVPDGTDTRALWYNKEIFAQAGLPTEWQPESWDDILTAARTIKQKVAGVIPFNIYSGKGVGEAASMQGFEMLLYGTSEDGLYDSDSQKWITGAPGFVDSLDLIRTVYDEGLAATPQQALDPNWNNTVGQQLIPEGKVAINLDGSWISQNWLDTGATPWPEWSETMGQAKMPSQDSADPVSLSGGWTYAIPKNSDNADMAWEFIELVTNKENQLTYDINAVQIPVRDDVAADPSYAEANPTNEFFASLVPDTKYRPAYAVYPRISNEIQVATEKVMTGQASPEEAAAAYDEQVRSIAGDAVTAASGS